jgi:hypothetical protein
VLERGSEEHGAEEQERDAVKQSAGLVGEDRDLTGVLPQQRSEQHAGHERGDEARPAESDSGPIRQRGGGCWDQLPPRPRDQTPAASELHDVGRETARRGTGHDPPPDLLEHHVSRVPGAGRGRQSNQQQRDADTVIEAALDIERLPYALWKPAVGNDRLPKTRVGRGEDHADDDGLADRQVPEQDGGQKRPERDRERQSDAQQAHRDLGFAS